MSAHTRSRGIDRAARLQAPVPRQSHRRPFVHRHQHALQVLRETGAAQAFGIKGHHQLSAARRATLGVAEGRHLMREVRAGQPRHSGMHLLGDADSATQAGVWECTPGLFDYTFPDHELCRIVSGEVLLTGPQGETRRLGPGGILITQRGETLTWDIRQTVRKVFLTW